VNRSRRLGSILIHVCLDELDNAVLLVAGKLVGLFKGQTELTGWSLGRAILAGAAEQFIGCDVQSIGDSGNLIGPQGNWIAFPVSDGALGGAELLGQPQPRQTPQASSVADRGESPTPGKAQASIATKRRHASRSVCTELIGGRVAN